MRDEFIAELADLAERDERIVLLTGDLGYLVLDRFADRHPERFFNVGIAEQNMTALATGLAEAGFVPFTYSIATFATLRPFEFIRNGPILHDLPVRIVGVGGGFDYGSNGLTHYALEDVGVLRTQPRIGIVTPADATQLRAALETTADVPGPLYFRVAKHAPPVPGLDGRFALGRMDLIGDGRDVAIVAMGSMTAYAVAAHDQLETEGVRATVGVVSNIAPAPVADLVALLEQVEVVVVAEAHYVNGGVGSLVCEVAAEHGLSCRVVRCGVRELPTRTGSTEWLLERHGLSTPQLADAAREALRAVAVR